MSTHYIDNASSSGSQYYFNANKTSTTSQSYQPYGSSGYSTYPTSISGSRSPNQQIRIDNSYQISPQQYQSVAGFNRNVTQQRYQTPQSPTPQVRASVRIVGSQEQYSLPNTSQPIQVSPQQHHFQFDSRQQPGHSTGPAVVYQTPGAAQFTHHNVDLWTEGPSQGSVQDQYVQAQRVSVRPVSTGPPQQSHSISPQRHQDHLQQYYSQLTPEQHQQLLRQQQLQRQQEQTSHYEQQHRVTAQQISPPVQQQHRSTAGFTGGQQQQQQQGRSRSESERQRQDEQDYYTAQRQIAVQRAQQQQQQQQEEEVSHPVGIRNLLSKFAGPAPTQQSHARSRSTASRQYSSSSYTTNSGPSQTTTRTLTSHSMTYSALPKNREPPVNSVEYYQMQQQSGNPFTNIQQAVAPPHIQHVQSPTGFGSLRDRFKPGSLSDDYHRPQQAVNRQPPPQQYQQQQQQQYQPQQTNAGGSSLSSLRNQYMNQTKQASLDEAPPQPVQNISRTIIGEDIPQQKPAPQPQLQQPAQVLQAPQQQQPAPASQAPQQPAPTAQAPEPEQSQAQNDNTDQSTPASEAAAAPPGSEDATTAAEGVSSF